jgi:ribose-phosphate pyrophosphokinase
MSNITFINGSGSIKWTTFSDKSETCLIKGDFKNTAHIQCFVEDATRDLIRLGLVKDALDRLGVTDVKLTLPYIPQARADRVFEKGMPLPIKVFTNIINSYCFSKVFVFDPHSDVSSCLINNVEIISQTELVKGMYQEINNLLPSFKLCAPDLGATKKIFETVKALNHVEYIQAIKIRDVKTGNIVKCDLTVDTVEGNILIVDDLCDGGASFKFLAKKLKEKGAEKVGLYVTHVILPNGLSGLEDDVDFIWTQSIVGNSVNHETLWKFNERNKGE